MSCGLENRLQGYFVLIYFRLIPMLELDPFLGIVAEPLSKLGTRRHILRPDGIGKCRLLYAPRPPYCYAKPTSKHAGPLARTSTSRSRETG